MPPPHGVSGSLRSSGRETAHARPGGRVVSRCGGARRHGRRSGRVVRRPEQPVPVGVCALAGPVDVLADDDHAPPLARVAERRDPRVQAPSARTAGTAPPVVCHSPSASAAATPVAIPVALRRRSRPLRRLRSRPPYQRAVGSDARREEPARTAPPRARRAPTATGPSPHERSPGSSAPGSRRRSRAPAPRATAPAASPSCGPPALVRSRHRGPRRFRERHRRPPQHCRSRVEAARPSPPPRSTARLHVLDRVDKRVVLHASSSPSYISTTRISASIRSRAASAFARSAHERDAAPPLSRRRTHGSSPVAVGDPLEEVGARDVLARSPGGSGAAAMCRPFRRAGRARDRGACAPNGSFRRRSAGAGRGSSRSSVTRWYITVTLRVKTG
jgi:hypothetical protein